MKTLAVACVVLFAVYGVFMSFRLEQKQDNIPSATMTQNRYVTSGNELEITLTPEFSVMKSRDLDGNIFVATSSQDLLIIRKSVEESSANYTQQEIVAVMYEEFKKITVENSGNDKRVWSDVEQGQLGNNTFLFRNAIRTRTLNGQEIKERVRQYITYNNGMLYFITFNNFFPDVDKSEYWDRIVSSIEFK